MKYVSEYNKEKVIPETKIVSIAKKDMHVNQIKCAKDSPSNSSFKGIG